MNKIFLLIIILTCFWIIACEPEVHPVSEFQIINCPSDTTIVLVSDTIPGSSIQFALPSFVNNCDLEGVTYVINMPTQISPGDFEIEYYVTNQCGYSDTCAFTFTALDYRSRFIGSYTGRKLCFDGWNYTDTLYNKIVTVEVDFSPNPEWLIVGGYDIPIDSTGSLINPSCCGYRWYAQTFSPNSLQIYTNDGSIMSPYECRFTGIKQ